jgi:hypothetical protein
MVRQLTYRKPSPWAPAVMVLIAAGGLLWHVLACVESPMAYSPSGKALAFTTMEPYDQGEDPLVAGKHVYRLMVLHGRKDLRVLAESSHDMLSAPVFSPNGRHIAYLRIPLFSQEDLALLTKEVQRREQLLGELGPIIWTHPPEGGATSKPTTAPVGSDDTLDHTLPPLRAMQEFCGSLLKYPMLSAVVEVRDAQDGALLSSAPIELPLAGEQPGLALTYITARPQYSPDGRWVYLCAGEVVMAVNPTTAEKVALAAPAAAAALAPDGKTVAILQEGAIGLIQTDGQAAMYVPWNAPASLSGLAWQNNKTLVLLEPIAGESAIVLHSLDERGKERRAVRISLPEHGAHKEENIGALALAPNGKHAVIAFQEDVFFLEVKGKLLKHWHGKDESLAQPTFSPDGKSVAFKVMQKRPDEHPRAAAIAFFSPEGQQISRVDIPRIDPTATQSAPK